MFVSSFGDHDPWGGITNLQHHSTGSPVCQGQHATVKEIAFLFLGCNVHVLELVSTRTFHRFNILGLLIHIHFIYVYLATEFWVLQIDTVLM